MTSEAVTDVADTAKRAALRRLFDPRSIAVIGASSNPAKRGHQAIRALQQSGYAHPVYPVHPQATEIRGLEVISSIEQLPPGVDGALIVLPGPAVPGALRERGAAGIAGAVLLANGFRKIGSAGIDLEADLLAVIADSGVRVIARIPPGCSMWPPERISWACRMCRAAGQRTALSHTGSIAGSDVVATAVLRQAGVELVQRSDELAVVAEALATTAPIRPGRRVAILSDGGGHAALAVDALTE